MNDEMRDITGKIANTVRQLSIEAIQKANSGHPGLPLGCAEIGAYLYGHLMQFNPLKPEWMNRDRFILSAGHGSMLLYSLLHLSGFPISMEDIKAFRQLNSCTPGHPEYDQKRGVEATTGPLGQGVANAVGQALGLKILEKKFNQEGHTILDPRVFCLAGDGCLMEGISYEACSLAGHLDLNNLVLLFDANKITLDGPLEDSSSEDVKKRFEAFGWSVFEMNGNDILSIDETMQKIRSPKKPTLVICHTVIGKGSPNKEGTHKVHGSPLGIEEVEKTKEALGLPEEPFYVSKAVKTFFEEKKEKQKELYDEWVKTFNRWKESYPDLYKEWQMMESKECKGNLREIIENVEIPSPIAGRAASNAILQALGEALPFLYGGSADLSGSDGTMMKGESVISKGHFEGKNIKYGIREFAMAGIASGLYQTGMIVPYVGTFLTFSDYMRNAVRLAALSPYQVIYQFTHDSVFLGEDGPTHQPVEHVAALRAMPNLHVFRPADAREVKGAWLAALSFKGPSALILSRQGLPCLKETEVPYEEGVFRGGYIVKKEKRKVDFTLFASGSELTLALDVATALEKLDKGVRVISMPSFELLRAQDEVYKEALLGGDLGQRVSIEAAVSFGWSEWIGREGISIAVEEFGHSAPMGDLAEKYGFTVDAILHRLL